MALYRSIGAALEDDNSGTNPIDVRKDLGGLFVRAGVLPGGTSPLVIGVSAWQYYLKEASWVTQTATGDGYHLWGNDGTISVGETGWGGTVPAAPGAGLERIDILWVRHPSNGENGDGTSAPACGVASGPAASSATAPALPAGAFELARNTMTSAATSTASTGNTITQTAPYTAPRGGVVLCRNTTERNALTASANAANPIYADVAGVLWTCNDATTWRAPVSVLPHLRITQASAQSRPGTSWGQVAFGTTADTAGAQPWTVSAGVVTLLFPCLISVDVTVSMSMASFAVMIYDATSGAALAEGPVGSGVASGSLSTTRHLPAGAAVLVRVYPASTMNIMADSATTPTFL